MTVDEYARTRVRAEQQALVATLRKLMREVAPRAEEAVSYGMPVWKRNRIFAWLSPSRNAVLLGFTRGAEFKDRYGLLRGVGKRGRHLRFEDAQDVNRTVLRYYTRLALAADARPLRA